MGRWISSQLLSAGCESQLAAFVSVVPGPRGPRELIYKIQHGDAVSFDCDGNDCHVHVHGATALTHT